LEDRTLLSTFTVVTDADNGPGTLRQALIDANGNPGHDVIDFDPTLKAPLLPDFNAPVIFLESALPNITDDLTITGLTTTKLRVNLSFDAPASNIFTVQSGVTVAISDLSIEDGQADRGAGIFNSGNLTLDHVTLKGNLAQLEGGGVYNEGTLVVTSSTFNGNGVAFPVGGQGSGGGIANHGLLTVTNSQFIHNSVNDEAGTFAGAGAALANHATATLLNSTFFLNAAATDRGIQSAAGTLHLKNTVVANPTHEHPDVDGDFISDGHNFIGNGAGATGFGAVGDQVGDAANPLDARLVIMDTTPLILFAVGIQFIAPLADSPLIDAGSNAGAPATDARGQPRLSAVNTTVDIGAFEVQRYLVTTVNDAGPGSLRQAILDSNTVPLGFSLIEFAIPGAGVHTIAPNSAGQGSLPTITAPVTLDAWSQGGPDYTGPPRIELDGRQAPLLLNRFPTSGGVSVEGGNGLRLATGFSLVRGFAINRFAGAGIAVDGRSNAIIGNYIGTDPSGEIAQGNLVGVTVGSGNPNGVGNQIGGGGPGERNVISGNRAGVHLENAPLTLVIGNFIGTNADGTRALGNTLVGIEVTRRSNDTLIGTGLDGIYLEREGNVISGNGNGILLTSTILTSAQVSGNKIGTNALGTGDLPNHGVGVGVSQNASGVIIGAPEDASASDAAGASNLIQGNDGPGVWLGASETVVQGNTIRGNQGAGVAVSAYVTAQGASPAAGFLNGQKVPDLTLQDQNGATVSLSDFAGKFVLLEYTVAWCIPCQQVAAEVNDVIQQLQAANLPFAYVQVLLQNEAGEAATPQDAQKMGAAVQPVQPGPHRPAGVRSVRVPGSAIPLLRGPANALPQPGPDDLHHGGGADAGRHCPGLCRSGPGGVALRQNTHRA
jgi:hypothetical protein